MRFGRDLSDEELTALHDCLQNHDAVAVEHEIKLIVEERWPHLLAKIAPPRDKMH